jgi:phenylpropionate dioxygenase-like ring-hydroxylating dioxygenase large terminal subunit
MGSAAAHSGHCEGDLKMTASIREIVYTYDSSSSLTGAWTPPASWYTDARILALEHRTVFSNSWQMAGRVDQVREPGQFIACAIAGEPILIIRGIDNILRGFFNVCRHHAAAVVTQPAGTTQYLRCPYHGWTYDLHGALIHTPEFGGVANFDRSANGLVPVEIEEWQRWLFAKLEPGGSSLKEYLRDNLLERFEPFNVEQLHWFDRRRYTLNCNWKVFVDNYLDGGYHVPHIHGGLSSVLDDSAYKIQTGERFCLQSSPIAAGKSESKTAAVRKGECAYYLWIYPNFMINIYEGVMDTNIVIPVAVNQTEVIFDYYFADVSHAAHQHNLASIVVSEQIQAEDVAICESVQQGLGSRVYNSGRLSVRREAGEHLFHRLLFSDISAAVPKE